MGLQLAGLALAGCGAATPSATAPANGETVVEVVAPVAPPAGSAAPNAQAPWPDPPKDRPDPHIARQAALRDAADFGMIGLFNSGATFDLSNVGSVTGTGIGLGNSSYSRDAVPGTSVNSDGETIVALGDAETLGVSLEQAARALRDHVYHLRGCYRIARDQDSQAEGKVAVRLVVGRDGYTALATVTSSELPRKEDVECFEKALRTIYVGVPSNYHLGVIETAFSFRPAPKK